MEPALDPFELMGPSPITPFTPQIMNTTFPPTSTRSKETVRSPHASVPVTDYSYQSPPSPAPATSTKKPEHQVELTNFRALSRSFFGGEAGREHLREGIVFAWIMIVAAWPLGVTLNML